jgi:hypothetical protein
MTLSSWIFHRNTLDMEEQISLLLASIYFFLQSSLSRKPQINLNFKQALTFRRLFLYNVDALAKFAYFTSLCNF